MKKYEDMWMVSCYNDDHDENNDDDNRWGVFIHRWTCLLQGHMRLRSLHSLTIQRCTDVVDDRYIKEKDGVGGDDNDHHHHHGDFFCQHIFTAIKKNFISLDVHKL